jgi:hypothetical protein
LHRVGHHQIRRIRDAARHVETNHQKSARANFAHGSFNLTAHQRTCQHKSPCARQPGHRADCLRKRLLTYQRNRIHRDMFAADVMPVRLDDRSQSHLTDLRPAAHDDDPFAVDLVHAFHQIDFADHRQLAQPVQYAIPRLCHNVEVNLRSRRGILNNRNGPDIARVPGNHAGKPVEDARPGIGVDHKTVNLRFHTGAIISNVTRRSTLIVAIAGLSLIPAFAKTHISRSEITAITDEIGKTEDDALEFARHYNLRTVGLRNVPGTDKLYASLRDADLKILAVQLAQAKIKVSTLYAPAVDARSQRVAAIVGAAQVIPMKPDSGPLRIEMTDPQACRPQLQKLQQENFKGEISLKTTPDKADEDMRMLMRIVGNL